MNNNVSFYPNTYDDTHCVPAAYKMILKYFLPEKDFSFTQLDKILGKQEGKGTWAAKGHLWLVDQGFEVEYWTLIDWPAFIDRGYDYLVEQFGKEVADYQKANGDLSLEQQRAAKALKKIKTVHKEPHIADIKTFLDKGYLIRCPLNAKKLNNQEGYNGHSVVVKGYDKKNLIIHDPGLPSLENRKVLFDDFEAAWAYPNKSAKEMVAVRLV